jgi:hypothetical protein
VNFRGGGKGWDGAILLTLAPHTPQNLPFSPSGEPQDAHILTGAGTDISGAGGVRKGGSPATDPQIPQYFSSGPRGLLQELQSTRTTGSAGAGGACRDCGG